MQVEANVEDKKETETTESTENTNENASTEEKSESESKSGKLKYMVIVSIKGMGSFVKSSKGLDLLNLKKNLQTSWVLNSWAGYSFLCWARKLLLSFLVQLQSMPHKWIFIQVDFFGWARPLPIASNRGQHLTRFLHKSIVDCPAPHKEINVFVHSCRFCNNSMRQCVLSALGFVHTLYTRPFTFLTSYNSTVALERSLSPDVMVKSSMLTQQDRSSLSLHWFWALSVPINLRGCRTQTHTRTAVRSL